MTEELLDPSDFSAAQANSVDFYLNMAGETIRDYCRWHIAPLATTTATVPVSDEGLIVLPTQQVSTVSKVEIGGATIASADYVLHKSGYIELRPSAVLPWAPQQTLEATVTFTHGYEEVPYPVRDVGNRLANRAMTMASVGPASTVQAGPFSISYGGSLLDASDMAQLGPYVLLKMDV